MIDWAAIVSTYEMQLWRTAYRILNHREDSLECCQQALLDAYEFARAEPVEDWRALLTSMTARRAIDRLRQRRRARAFVALDEIAEPSTDSGCPVESMIALELMERLRDALTELPTKQAEVFWLSSVESLSHAEISRQLAMTQNESHVLLHRARHRLAMIIARPSAAGKTR